MVAFQGSWDVVNVVGVLDHAAQQGLQLAIETLGLLGRHKMMLKIQGLLEADRLEGAFERPYRKSKSEFLSQAQPGRMGVTDKLAAGFDDPLRRFGP